MRFLTVHQREVFRRVFDFGSNVVDKSHVYVILLLCFHVLQLADAAPRQGGAHGQQIDDNCRGRGKFTECLCDEFAVILPTDKQSEYVKAGIAVYGRPVLSHDTDSYKKQFYYCQKCQKCGDGVLEVQKCTQRADTNCSYDKCTDDTWAFIFVLKACLPPPTTTTTTTTTTTPPLTVKSEVTWRDTASVAVGPATGSKVTAEKPKVGSQLWLQENSRVIMLGLIGGVALLTLVLLLMAVVVFRMRRQVGGLLTSGTPSSSNNSSRESVSSPVNV